MVTDDRVGEISPDAPDPAIPDAPDPAIPDAPDPGAAPHEPAHPDSADHAVEEVPGDLPYPDHWEADVVLRDGRTCHIRPIRHADKEALLEFHRNLSQDTLYTRFFSISPDLAVRDVDRLLTVDHRTRVGLIAFMGERVIGLGSYDGANRAEAEIAFTIGDDNQGRGLGSVLLEHLAAIARENGIHRFKAEVLPDNKRMLQTFTAAGYTPSSEVVDSIAVLDFDIDPTAKSRHVARAREHRAESLSIGRLVAPKRVAVVCDDFEPGSVGEVIVGNLAAAQFAGQVYEVDTSGTAGRFSGIGQLGCEVDLVVAALAPGMVEELIPAFAQAGVRGIILVSGGFVVSEHLERQRDLAHKIREAGMRLIGPSALGLINTSPSVRLNASLVPQIPGRGRIGVFTQTGAFGSAMLRETARRGLGVSTFVSVGNRADVSANDMLQYWQDDDSTSLVLLYLESIGNPRKFIRIARRLALRKPVVAVRTGRSTHALPLGHAVRHTDLPSKAIDSMFEQAGVIQVDTLVELLDLAGLLALQPYPRGDRVAFVSDSEGLALLAVDVAESLGLNAVGTRVTAPEASTQEFEAAISAALADPGVDSVVVAHAPPSFGATDSLANALARQARSATKPLLAVILAGQAEPLVTAETVYRMPSHGSVPVFGDVESALRALRSVVTYMLWRGKPRGKFREFSNIEQRRAIAAVTDLLGPEVTGEAQLPLSGEQLTHILDSYGIDLWRSIDVDSESEAVFAAAELGYPVALKCEAPELVHRSELGGVRLTLENELALRTAYLSMVATLPPEAVAGLAVQRMAPAGIVCAATTVEDRLFGPVVSFRIGGVITRILGDDGFRIPPFTNEDAKALLRIPKASSLLFSDELRGILGEAAGATNVDVGALADLLERLARLADDLPEIARLELNPIVAHEHGIAVLGATGCIGRPQIRTDLEARRLL